MKKMASGIMLLFVGLLFFTAIPYAIAGDVKYTYDNAGRLIKAEYDNGVSIQYTYDNAGNLFSRTVSSGQPGTYTLTVNKAGTGTGTVTGPGINCGSSCSASCKEGTKVTLKAKADGNSAFTGWSGGGCSGTKTCTVTVNGSVAVTADFALKTPDISVAQTSLEFGSIKVGKKATKTLKIMNNGTGDLMITLSGLEGTHFSIQGSTSVTIKSKKSYTLKVLFTPKSAGSETATLTIGSNDSDTPTIDISLSGTGQ